MKIPSHAQEVFQGTIYSVYQWEQELYDGTHAIFEGLKRPGTVQIIPTLHDKVLLSYEEQPMKPRRYTFFGGRMEAGEDPLTTAKRELLEETGCTSDDWELYKTYEFEGKIEWSTYLFIARNCTYVAKQRLDPGEKIEIKEVSFDDFIDIASHEDFWSSVISNDLFRMRQDPEKIKAFKQSIFQTT